MANLTITVDEATLKRARIRALQEDTSVNRVLAAYLEEYAGRRREEREAAARVLEDARLGGAGSGGRVPRREEVYGERLERYPGA